MTDFHLADVIARVTERRLRDPDFWRQQRIPIPARYVEGEIAIPASILKPTCWECGREIEFSREYRALCVGCRASLRQQYREQEDRDAREDNGDE